MGETQIGTCGYHPLSLLILTYCRKRNLKIPRTSDRALDWALTELAEAKELLLAEEGGWIRNNPQDHPDYSDAKFAEELGDIIAMVAAAGIIRGLDPFHSLVEKMSCKLSELGEGFDPDLVERARGCVQVPPDELESILD